MAETGQARKFGWVRYRVRCDSGHRGKAESALLGLRERWQLGRTKFDWRAAQCRSAALVARRIPRT